MKSTDSRRPSSGKRHDKNPLPESHSKASGSPKASKASSAVQSSGAASKAGARANGTKKPHQLASLSKASSSAKSSKGRSSVQGSDAASKADAKEDGTGKRPLVAEPSTARGPSGAAVEKGGATTTDVKADRADKTLISRDPRESGRPKEPKDDGSKAAPEDDDDSRFESAQSTLFLAAHIETKAKRMKQAQPSQESVTKEKNKGGAKKKQTTSPATSLPAPEVNIQEKTAAAVNGEADAKAPKTQEKKHSITYNKITAKSHEGKKQRKKRGHSRGNKAVQTNPEEAQTAPAEPPIHLLFSPSSCSLCDRNAPPSYYGAMQTFQIGKYGAVTPAQQRSRGVVKKTTTTTTTRCVQDSDSTPRSRQLVEETTTGEVQEAADDRSDAGGSKDSTSVAGNVTSGGAVKKTVTTTRRLKNRDKHGRNSSDDKDPRPQDDVIETVIREVVEVESESAPVIVGLARGASATQYRYVESRRPASSPYRARHGVDAVYQRMELRLPGFWANQPYWRALLKESLQTVYVPPGLVNASVPENSTMLAFHLSRVATRLFRTLVPLASAEGGQCSVPSALTQQSQRSLVRLRKCLAKDAQSLPAQLQLRASDVLWDGEGREGEEAGFAILAQTAALGLAFAAFKDMLRVDLIWRLNFRFASLANVSADQLFFLYYALDNCEHSDRTHRAHEYSAWRRLPAEQRVNLPLRQMARFAEAFGCEPRRSAMAPMNRCGVLRWPAPRPGLSNDGR
ncbi:nucleolar and coiled-body phosphoprotein 1-like [Dermacentor albipictus]|uniref:nucleolar and coiled-body phosphoprotein 1-like n=1 Tax=Dermacentor albipictus TaxID=60249 RepID=UPI0038FCE88F